MNKIDTKPIPITSLLRLVKTWESENHIEPSGNIIFQNREFKLNVRFTNESLNAIKKNPRGVENLPEAIKNPLEIWARWDDPEKQQAVLMNYILSDEKHIFVVQTKSGEIVNSLINMVANINMYRKGIVFMK